MEDRLCDKEAVAGIRQFRPGRGGRQGRLRCKHQGNGHDRCRTVDSLLLAEVEDNLTLIQRSTPGRLDSSGETSSIEKN